ncbi:hypothetical protein CVT25_008619 [Psilocybe cyanescens]|uniref:Uncharacterized protein n=1 Tax=Psilocybe cyanescens TaxID=93625 RepID=A0A409XDA7_PSICY|nr:hypothetical protein CVT25_008619 [Psilocybe cyanescens]
MQSRYAVDITRFGRSCHYHRTRTNNPAQSRWYRRSIDTAKKACYTGNRFYKFVREAGKGAFVDAELRPMRWWQLNIGEAYRAYSWAIQTLPLLLDKSGYSEELIAYAHQASIMRTNDYLNFTFSEWDKKRRSAQAAVKAYLRRAEDGQI